CAAGDRLANRGRRRHRPRRPVPAHGRRDADDLRGGRGRGRPPPPAGRAAVADDFASVPVGSPFVVVDRATLLGRVPKGDFRTTTAFLNAPDDALAGIRTALASEAPLTTVEARIDRAIALETAPVVDAVTV